MKELIQDHLGITYPSKKDMCEHYNIAVSTFYQRYHVYNWTLKDALTIPAKHTSRKK